MLTWKSSGGRPRRAWPIAPAQHIFVCPSGGGLDLPFPPGDVIPPRPSFTIIRTNVLVSSWCSLRSVGVRQRSTGAGPGSTATLGQRSYLVIARLVVPGGEEQRWPTRTVRWTATKVQVTFEPAAGEPVYVWFSADDVRRTIHMPAAAGEIVQLEG